jgi:hypothetical protein
MMNGTLGKIQAPVSALYTVVDVAATAVCRQVVVQLLAKLLAKYLLSGCIPPASHLLTA